MVLIVAALLDRLLGKLGLRRVERRKFTLDAALVQYVQALADDEQRPPEELAADLLNSGLAQRDLAQESWQRWRTLSRREQEVAALICLGMFGGAFVGSYFAQLIPPVLMKRLFGVLLFLVGIKMILGK